MEKVWRCQVVDGDDCEREEEGLITGETLVLPKTGSSRGGGQAIRERAIPY